MKEIFDWLREAIDRVSLPIKIKGKDAQVDVIGLSFVSVLIAEAEAKWKEKEAELSANVIDEFAERIKDWMLENDGLSEKDIQEIDEIASQMKGEKE